jgi:hypothetical protein
MSNLKPYQLIFFYQHVVPNGTEIFVIFQWNFCFDFLINQLINLFLAALAAAL